MKLDLTEFEETLRNMTRQSKAWEIAKRVLGERGYWRNKPRGDPKKGYAMMKDKSKKFGGKENADS